MRLYNKKNTNINQSAWDAGIPKYTDADLMTETDKLIFAMNVVKQFELDKNGFKTLAASSQIDKVPNFVCEKGGRKWFIVVKCAIAPDMPSMSVPEKKYIIKHAQKCNADAYFAPVGIGACDATRFDASLALKNDSYYTNYIGLERLDAVKSDEWIKQTLIEISKLDPANKQHENSSIRYSIRETPSDVRYSLEYTLSDFEKWKSELDYPTFQEMLLTCIERKEMSYQTFYKAAYIDRKLFSTIKNNKEYRPKKETAVSCCLGLGLDLSDAEKLLSLAGYKLSLSLTWDRIVYYCLSHGIKDVETVNELLYAQGEKCIGV